MKSFSASGCTLKPIIADVSYRKKTELGKSDDAISSEKLSIVVNRKIGAHSLKIWQDPININLKVGGTTNEMIWSF